MHFKFAHVLKLLMFCATKGSSPCISTLINLLSARDRLRLEREERATARLHRRCQREGRRSERTEVRKARLDRQSRDDEESVVFNGSISVELDSEGPSCQLALNIKI